MGYAMGYAFIWHMGYAMGYASIWDMLYIWDMLSMAYGICFLWSIWDMGIGFPDTDAYKAYPICDTLYFEETR